MFSGEKLSNDEEDPTTTLWSLLCGSIDRLVFIQSNVEKGGVWSGCFIVFKPKMDGFASLILVST